MLRTHHCGELHIGTIHEQVTLAGWVHRIRDKGGMLWIDLRDYYGVTQLVIEAEKSDPLVLEKARSLSRECVIQATGHVLERQAKNPKINTGEVEVSVSSLNLISASLTPPFTLEENTDGGDDFRMQYRYLDLRRSPLRKNLQLRHQMAQQTRLFLNDQGFMEIETPVLIKSTPEGARDFVVPSRMEKGAFYALPQSPQTYKQLLMVSGFDRYYQIVKCFRDEDFRADRQPEFTQIDCEMAFVEQDDILSLFEGLIRHLFKHVKGVHIPSLPRMSYEEAMRCYGSDKPDTRFDMPLITLNEGVKGNGFAMFDRAELIVGICAKQCASYTRKQLDMLTDFVKTPQINAQGLVYVRYHEEGTFKSSVDKFYSSSALKRWAVAMHAEPGDLMLILAGDRDATRKAMGILRLHMGDLLKLRHKDSYSLLWIVDFPLFEWDEESRRFYAKHHPFTAPKPEDMALLDTNPEKARACAYDMVINGTEVGGGSIRIHDSTVQQTLFKALGLSEEEAEDQFGFLLKAFQYGAPPHGGIAFGFDRLCALFSGTDSIRDVIAFPKNNAGKDTMTNSPSTLSQEQLDALGIALKKDLK